MSALLVVLGALVGAPLRYAVDVWLRARLAPECPWGTFAVNVAGSASAGAVAAAVAGPGAAPSWVFTLVGTGFCGALTTFSTFGYETVRLAEQGRAAAALVNVGSSVVAGYTACAAGWAVVVLVR